MSSIFSFFLLKIAIFLAISEKEVTIKQVCHPINKKMEEKNYFTWYQNCLEL